MKVALINNLYKPYNKGGAERIVEIQKKFLVEDGHEVLVITSSKNNFEEVQKNKSKILYLKNCNFFSYVNIDKYNIVFRAIWRLWDMFNFCLAWRIRQILKREKVDYIVYHNLTGLSYLTVLFTVALAKNNVLILHDVQLLYPSGLVEKEKKNIALSLYQFFTRKLFKKVNLFISPSEFLKNFYLKYNFTEHKKVKVLANPIEDKLYKNVKRKLDKNKIKFLFVGHLNDGKGIKSLLGYFKQKENHNLHLYIVGDGYLRNEIELLSEKYENIECLGRLPHDQVLKLYEKMNFLLVPSLIYENFPTVILEAVAKSLPVIARKIGGVRDFENMNLLAYSYEKDEELVDVFNQIKQMGDEEYLKLQEKIFSNAQQLNIKNYKEKFYKYLFGKVD